MTQTALQRAATYFDGEIVIPLRQIPMGRKLLSVKPKAKGDGISAADVLKIVEMGAAQMAYKLPKEMSRDMIGITKESVNIPVLYKGYEVDRSAMNAFALQNVPLDSAAAVSAAQVVAVMEDTAIIDGWKPQGTEFVMRGLYNTTGATTDGTTYDFGAYGGAKTAVTALMAKLEVEHVYPPFNLSLNPVQHGELIMSESTSGIEEYPRILRILNGNTTGGPGRIFSSSDIEAGTGMISPVDPGRVYMELLNPVSMRNVLGEDSKMPGISDITGTTYEALYVNVKQPKAIGTLTVI